jgi:hypothetical protein
MFVTIMCTALLLLSFYMHLLYILVAHLAYFPACFTLSLCFCQLGMVTIASASSISNLRTILFRFFIHMVRDL